MTTTQSFLLQRCQTTPVRCLTTSIRRVHFFIGDYTGAAVDRLGKISSFTAQFLYSTAVVQSKACVDFLWKVTVGRSILYSVYFNSELLLFATDLYTSSGIDAWLG